jgi:uncharacterized membrane protein
VRAGRSRSRPLARGPVPAALVAGTFLVAGCAGAADDAGTDTPAEADALDEDGDEVAGEDRDRYEAEARELLGLPEDAVEEDERTRIVRRGDEDLPATMDLSPGRRNVELDEEADGRYVVTRVIVEVADGDPVVVE